jgi:hypothetical protein
MFIYDGTTGANLQTVDLGGSIPFGADVVESALNLKSNKMYIANYGGFGINTQAPIPPSVEVYNASTMAHLASVPNVVGPLAVDSVLNAIYGMSKTRAGSGGDRRKHRYAEQHVSAGLLRFGTSGNADFSLEKLRCAAR